MPKLLRRDLAAALAPDGGPLALHRPSLASIFAVQDGNEDVTEALKAAITPATERATARKEGAVAIVPVTGVITTSRIMQMIGLGTSPDSIARNVDAAQRDPQVKAVVLAINSPGGSVSGVDEAANAIFAHRGGKPMVAQVTGMMASAAYWIGAAADEIVMPATGTAGSIGVWTQHDDFSKYDEMNGFKTTLIHAGKYKVEGNPFEPLSDEARAHIQEDVDYFYGMFTKSVARSRGVTPKQVQNGYGEGRLLAGTMALEAGLVDKIRSLSETLAAYGVTPSAPEARGRAMAFERESRELDFLE